MRATIAAAIVCVSALALAPQAHAQNAAAADALFQKGKDAFDAKRYAEACPAFAESYRLDPVSGSLIALASCYEADGKLASAWSKYGELASVADREGRKDRADGARQRVKELEPKLARLTITVSPDAAAISGLVVKRDGTAVGSPTYGVAIPIDRGEHTIEASAPGHSAFTQKVNVQDGATMSVSIPALAAEAGATGGGEAPPPPPPATEGSSIARPLGWGALGVGVVAMGIGAYFGASAISKNTESNTGGGCDKATNRCDLAGTGLRNDARSQGNTSTVLFVVGGIFVAAGITMVIVGGSKSQDAKPTASLVPAVARDRAGLSFEGRF
jgi:hypothetical protein